MREDYLRGDEESLSAADKEVERALRPLVFEEFFGQDKVVDNVKIFVLAAKKRNEPLDHVLLHGPPGLGKTTLSHIISNELNANLKISSGPVLDKPGDLAGLLTNLEPGDVLFIDEIHRLNPVVEEYLYSAMEDYKIDIMLDSPSARSGADQPESIHFDRRHHARWFAYCTVARTLWHQCAARILRWQFAAQNRTAVCAHTPMPD